MPHYSSKSALAGRRVEIPAYCDLWMQGARCGEIHSVSTDGHIARVRLDHPQVKKLARVILGDCRFLFSDLETQEESRRYYADMARDGYRAAPFERD